MSNRWHPITVTSTVVAGISHFSISTEALTPRPVLSCRDLRQRPRTPSTLTMAIIASKTQIKSGSDADQELRTRALLQLATHHGRREQPEGVERRRTREEGDIAA